MRVPLYQIDRTSTMSFDTINVLDTTTFGRLYTANLDYTNEQYYELARRGRLNLFIPNPMITHLNGIKSTSATEKDGETRVFMNGLAFSNFFAHHRNMPVFYGVTLTRCSDEKQRHHTGDVVELYGTPVNAALGYVYVNDVNNNTNEIVDDPLIYICRLGVVKSTPLMFERYILYPDGSILCVLASSIDGMMRFDNPNNRLFVVVVWSRRFCQFSISRNVIAPTAHVTTLRTEFHVSGNRFAHEFGSTTPIAYALVVASADNERRVDSIVEFA